MPVEREYFWTDWLEGMFHHYDRLTYLSTAETDLIVFGTHFRSILRVIATELRIIPAKTFRNRLKMPYPVGARGENWAPFARLVVDALEAAKRAYEVKE